MVRGEDNKWRTISNEKLYAQKMLIGALYRTELARGLEGFSYRVEKTHADGRFEVEGVPREVIEALGPACAELPGGIDPAVASTGKVTRCATRAGRRRCG